MEIPIENIYYLLCYAWNKLEEKEIVNVGTIDGTKLADLFAKVLINGLSHLLKSGLDRGYIEYTEETRCLRGKVCFSPTIKKNLLPQAKVVCECDELDHDILHNKIIKSTIKLLITVRDLDYELKKQLIGLYRKLHGVEEIELNDRIFSMVQLNRNRSFYDFLLKICSVIYNNLLFTQEPGSSKFMDFFQDKKSMPYLFEDFVRNFYKIETSEYRVYREDIAWQAEPLINDSHKFLPKMETDISIEGQESKVVIDTKYYKEALGSHYGSKKIQSEHLYQLYAYLNNLEHKQGINKDCAGVILYPTVKTDLCLSYKIGNHNLTICTINLNQLWWEIHKDLIDIVDSSLKGEIPNRLRNKCSSG